MPSSKRKVPLVCLSDYEAAACKRLPAMAREYLTGGAADEITLGRNRSAFDALLLKPRVLRDVSHLDTSLDLLGRRAPHPILLAPAAYQKLFHREGEQAAVRGASAREAIFVASSFATVSLEDTANAARGPIWFQLYMPAERAISKDMVQRAEVAGYQAIVMTVDTPVLGVRNREMRTGFHLPPGLHRENLRRYHSPLADAAHFGKKGEYAAVLDASLTWADVDWVRSLTKLPILLKGILAPEDAELAIRHGAAGIIVSNHGARNLDTVPAAIEALQPVAKVVAGRIPILLDGGIRRGTDVIKALALGARAVLVGRPYLWGLAVAGAEGVEDVIRILLDETRSAMALCGRPTLSAIDRTVLWTEE